MKQVTKKTAYGEALVACWSCPADPPGERTAWITVGRPIWTGFHGHKIAVDEKDIPALITALRGLVGKKKLKAKKKKLKAKKKKCHPVYGY